MNKRITNSDIRNESVQIHSQNDTQTIKDNSTSTDIKTVRKYPLITVT